MYPARKSNAISEEEAIKICGKELVERVKSINCEFTNRVIDECEEVTEMSASVDFDDGSLTILYLKNFLLVISENAMSQGLVLQH